MEREIKVRIDLLLDNQASVTDSLKALGREADKVEEKFKRLKSLQASGGFDEVLHKDLEVQRRKHQLDFVTATATQPAMEARRRLDIEAQIFRIQQQRSMLAVNRPHELALMLNHHQAASERAAMARDVHYQARYGGFAPLMSGADRLTMSGFGYASVSGTMLGMSGSAGGTAVGTFTGALRRAAGEIGLMFTPAIMSAANLLHRFGGWVRDLNPALKTTIGYLATYGLALSAGAKVVSLVGGLSVGVRGFAAALTAATARLAVAGAVNSAGSAASSVAGASAASGAGGAIGGGAGRLAGGAAAATGSGAASGGLAAGALKWGGRAAGLVGSVAAAGFEGYFESKERAELAARHGILPSQVPRLRGPGSNLMNLPLEIIDAFRQRNGRPTSFEEVASRLGKGGSGPKPGGLSQAPLAIPGFQSQQYDIFDLKNAIQMVSLRSPNDQATFEQSVREFQAAVRDWAERQERLGGVVGAEVRESLRWWRL